MSNQKNEPDFVEGQLISFSAIEAQDRALIDKQIATAKMYPRDIKKAMRGVVELATLDIETAKTIGYTLPRGGKEIKGPSVALARIVAQQYGNIRVDAKVIDIDATHITSQATCIDLENNVGIRLEVKARITKKNGERYDDDMITVTGNAASSKALRNAVFATVPKSLVDAGYDAAQEMIEGELKNEEKFKKNLKKTIEHLEKQYKVTAQNVCNYLGIQSIESINPEQLAHLIGLVQGMKEGRVKVEDAFKGPEAAKREAENNANTQEIKMDVPGSYADAPGADKKDGALF